jgi:hypothetical protein
MATRFIGEGNIIGQNVVRANIDNKTISDLLSLTIIRINIILLVHNLHQLKAFLNIRSA